MTLLPNDLSLHSLPFIPLLDANGSLPGHLVEKVGAYAIYAEDQTLMHLGYSRNILLSLKQHLVRQPQSCHWIKVTLIQKPSRAVLQQLLEKWEAETSAPIYSSNNPREAWENSIDIKAQMTPKEQETFQSLVGDEIGLIKHLKKVGRRLEADIRLQLEERGFQDELRFNPKLKESGLLDLK